MSEYDVEKLRGLWEELPDIRVRFSGDETGWGKDLGNGRAVIANIPLADGLCFMDVVELNKRPGESAYIKRVVWRAYEKKTGITYPTSGKPEIDNARWGKIYRAFSAVGCEAESYAEGMIAVCHHESTDLLGVLKDAGIDTTFFKLH